MCSSLMINITSKLSLFPFHVWLLFLTDVNKLYGEAHFILKVLGLGLRFGLKIGIGLRLELIKSSNCYERYHVWCNCNILVWGINCHDIIVAVMVIWQLMTITMLNESLCICHDMCAMVMSMLCSKVPVKCCSTCPMHANLLSDILLLFRGKRMCKGLWDSANFTELRITFWKSQPAATQRWSIRHKHLSIVPARQGKTYIVPSGPKLLN